MSRIGPPKRDLQVSTRLFALWERGSLLSDALRFSRQWAWRCAGAAATGPGATFVLARANGRTRLAQVSFRFLTLGCASMHGVMPGAGRTAEQVDRVTGGYHQPDRQAGGCGARTPIAKTCHPSWAFKSSCSCPFPSPIIRGSSGSWTTDDGVLTCRQGGTMSPHLEGRLLSPRHRRAREPTATEEGSSCSNP